MYSNEIKRQFPFFSHSDIAYLDSGATSQKPQMVIDEVKEYYETINSNPHRGAYTISIEATEAYENARKKVAEFINSESECQILFTKNATEALNLVAYSYGLQNVNQGDEVVLSIMEHHSNLVPWQFVTKTKHAELKYIYLNDDFELSNEEIDNKITNKTRIVGITHISNVLGTINDVKRIINKAHEVGAIVVLDCSQSIAHMKIDVQELDADFVAFSGHKMYAPMGIGVLYGKKKLLDKMTPFLMGGDMIDYVYEQDTVFAELPNKFEAGTQNVGGAIGLGKAIDFIQSIGYDNIQRIENQVTNYALEELQKLDFVQLYVTSNKQNHASVISFNVKGVHPHDVASILDSEGVCIRAGNHCAHPLIHAIGVDSTCRASFAVYNTKEGVDKLIIGLKKVYETFRKYIKQ